jgi:hypothetical protein
MDSGKRRVGIGNSRRRMSYLLFAFEEWENKWV